MSGKLQASNFNIQGNSKVQTSTMKTVILLGLLIFSCSRSAPAQVGGNLNYGQAYGRARVEQNERAKRTPIPGEPSPGTNAMFLEASVLMNVKADEYIALFGISQEGGTLAECNQKLDNTVAEFTAALRACVRVERDTRD